MNEKEAREIKNSSKKVKDGTVGDVYRNGIATGYLEAIEKAKVLGNYLGAYCQDCECPVDYREDAQEALAKWEKEK